MAGLCPSFQNPDVRGKGKGKAKKKLEVGDGGVEEGRSLMEDSDVREGSGIKEEEAEDLEPIVKLELSRVSSGPQESLGMVPVQEEVDEVCSPLVKIEVEETE